MGIMRSLNKKEYRHAKKKGILRDTSSVVGTFYRTGYSLRRLANGLTRVCFVMEMDPGGNFIMSSFGGSLEMSKFCVMEAMVAFYRLFVTELATMTKNIPERAVYAPTDEKDGDEAAEITVNALRSEMSTMKVLSLFTLYRPPQTARALNHNKRR